MTRGMEDTGPARRRRLDEIRSAETLAELARLTGAPSEHDAYFEAKSDWYELMGDELPPAPRDTDDVPGETVTVDGHDFHVHGVTHSGTDEERDFLRRHVRGYLDRGAVVYCEQGIRSMYFSDLDGVCGMDDYRWSVRECERLELGTDLCVEPPDFDGIAETADSLGSRLRDAVFSLVDSGGCVYGDRFAESLGDAASEFLVSHEGMAKGEDFEAYKRTREAADDPTLLGELQRYYRRKLLPQPLEREWLRRHDRELEIFTHARNERIADYTVYHNDEAEEVHLVVGAAHQPGVVYYLERHRDGDRTTEGFELLG